MGRRLKLVLDLVGDSVARAVGSDQHGATRLHFVGPRRDDDERVVGDLQRADGLGGHRGLLARAERLCLLGPVVLEDQRHVEVGHLLPARLWHQRHGDRTGVRQRRRRFVGEQPARDAHHDEKNQKRKMSFRHT